MTLIPTEEQNAVIAEARSSDSLLINALAGAAKTTTLCLMAKAMRPDPTLCVAFNKRIAVEMASRMPGHVECSTLNSVGHRAWSRTIGKRLIVDTDKTYNIAARIRDALPPAERRDLRESFASLLKATRVAKSVGYVPESLDVGETLVDHYDFLDALDEHLDIDLDDQFLYLLDKILEHSIADSYSGLIDFDDQIYMSTLFGGAYPKYPVLMVDEAQDLSTLNHRSLRLMYGARLIAVGDPHQAIYAFRGAHHTSMEILKETFSMKELTLSTSFRCPQAVVRNVHWRVPHMRWPEWASEGSVVRLEKWSSNSIPDGSAVICRNNAPIFSVALELIKAGKGVKIVGNDVGASLTKVLQKLGPSDMSQEATFAAIDAWEEASEKKARKNKIAAIKDKAACLRIFANAGRTLEEAIAYATMIFSASGPIQLMTGHKAKGGEWDIVFHLDSHLVPSVWARTDAAKTQENNLKYVIDTRAKQTLYYIDSEDYE